MILFPIKDTLQIKAWPFGRAFCSIFILMFFFVSCSSNEEKTISEDALVVIGDSELTLAEMQKQMPGGLSSDDSTKFARAYIRSWIDAKLISQIASKEINTSDIDKLVEQYRNELIMWEYTKLMYDTNANIHIAEDSLLNYYDNHKDEFVLSRPMVKGVYLKVADNAPSLSNLKMLYRSQKENDIDKLDKSELNGAVHYDFFRDKWIDWEQIENRIPMDFGSSADAFLKTNKNIDFSAGGFTYLLDITDVLFSGQTMPYEAARQQIQDRINFYNRKIYEDELKKNLYDNAVSSGKIRIFTDLGS